MIEKILVVTNNPMSKEKLGIKFTVEFIDGSVVEVLKKVRDYIHKGHVLLTHPLMSSVKPNETPYRTIILTKEGNNNIDFKSLGYIEESIASTEKFLNMFGIPNWSSSLLEDFKLIDYDLISHALE
jgi:hypothetical protein